MTRLRRADCFWLAAAGLLAVAVVYNVFIAEDGATLSEVFDGYIERWPWLKPAILIVARHVVNDLDPRADPIGIGFVLVRAVFRRRRAVAAAVVVVD
ncbi:DUF7427 family protein [Mycobacterium intracellulare]|uniref:Uncharacterized protein n=1 Tax=Mycobacterium intracellulare TaxID=1767 RepID=A0AAE4REG1_MYCIT|nr:hypothetical protein [Mycobacterium intracellulare]MDV6979677.1 hypothetical protein [Mycobacterium intracellulare]MDV6985180.1 hypothetical protein [Mycobacterium intracellulare]MDV7014200.1 hypothetical protein [Mycobacterium intracellulare]MDV7030171.1 hypothetical protein [Mycobacterium intracellulare]